MRVRLLPEAENELLEAAQGYKQQSVGLDYKFMRCIDEAMTKIGRTPLMFLLFYEGQVAILET